MRPELWEPHCAWNDKKDHGSIDLHPHCLKALKVCSVQGASENNARFEAMFVKSLAY